MDALFFTFRILAGEEYLGENCIRQGVESIISQRNLHIQFSGLFCAKNTAF